MSCLHILEINPLLVTSFANIFSHSVGFLSCWWFPFDVQKLLTHFCFHFHYSRGWIKKDIAAICVSVLPTLSSRSFTVSGLTFRSLNHFEFICIPKEVLLVLGPGTCETWCVPSKSLYFSQPYGVPTLRTRLLSKPNALGVLPPNAWPSGCLGVLFLCGNIPV